MTKLHHEVEINAPVENVWKVLADLEAVQYYNPIVAHARYTSQNKEGVGASRHCDFKPNGFAKERVIAYEPKNAITMEMYESNWPVKFTRWRTELQPKTNSTLVVQNLEYEVKFGPLGKLMDTFMMRKKFDSMLIEIFNGLKNFVESKNKQ